MSQKTEIKAIDSISTKELIDELTRRCTPAIFVGYKNEEDGENVFFEYYGHAATCYGLCHQLAFQIQSNEMRNILSEVDDD